MAESSRPPLSRTHTISTFYSLGNASRSRAGCGKPFPASCGVRRNLPCVVHNVENTSLSRAKCEDPFSASCGMRKTFPASCGVRRTLPYVMQCEEQFRAECGSSPDWYLHRNQYQLPHKQQLLFPQVFYNNWVERNVKCTRTADTC